MDQMPNSAIEIVRREITDLAIVEGYQVATSEEAQSANEQLRRIKGLGKTLAEAKDAERRPLNDQLKAISATYLPAEQLLDKAEKTLKTALLQFMDSERRRIEQQRRLEVEAAARERARLEEEARKERERAEAQAAKLREQGKEEKAEAVLQVAESQSRAKETVAAMVAAPTAPAAPAKLEGARVSEVWTAKVDDLPKFLASIAASPFDIADVVTINQAGLNRLARSLKGNMEKQLPGCIAWPEQRMGSVAK